MSAATPILRPRFNFTSPASSASDVSINAGVVPANARRPIAIPNLKMLEELYQLHERDGVLRFLAENPAALPTLLEAYSWVRQFFPDTVISLAVVTDHDAPGPGQYIRVSIRTHLEPPEAVDKLKEFDESWWLDSPLFPHGLLLFTLEWA